MLLKNRNKNMGGKIVKNLIGWKKRKSNYIYYFKSSVSKRFNIKRINFIGFKTIPVGLFLYKTGGGFNRQQSNKIGGDFLLYFLSRRYKKGIKLYVYNDKKNPSFKELKKDISINLSLENFLEILKNLGDEIKEKRECIIEKRLSKFFPKEFKDERNDEKTISSKLNEINLNKLKSVDHNILISFIKKYLDLSINNKDLEKLQTDLVIQGKKKTLNDVIKKFEKHINNKDCGEKKWQKFLHEEVFFFLSNYVESIREADINFGKIDEGEKKPDFIWIDLYGFLDVFEIKTPFTDILAKRIDNSHKNYYFSTSASKAIAQIEKYTLFIERNIDNFTKYLSGKTKIPFSVLKPKAFLIIGNSKELEKNTEKKRDFRLLRRLFKNIEFITFNELLDNLKSLASKFDKDKK
jgi:hypothetical protein